MDKKEKVSEAQINNWGCIASTIIFMSPFIIVAVALLMWALSI